MLLVSNIHADGALAASVACQLTVKLHMFSGGWSVTSKASTVFEGSMVGLLVSFLVFVFEKLKQTEQSVAVTSGARPPLLHPQPPFDAGWLFISSTSFKSMFTEGRKSDKFPRPSLATDVSCFYWAIEMVRV